MILLVLSGLESPMRAFPVLLLLLVQWPTIAAEPAADPPSTQLKCESRDLAFDSKEIRCPLPNGKQNFRLKAYFSGGHDDTQATMTASLDDEVLACDAGSKTRLASEDGDVSLTCLFVSGARARAASVLRTTVSWSHAQYTGYSFEAY